MASQFSLLGSRLFAPFFWVQFGGASNDNLFKFGVTLLLTYQLPTTLFDSSLAGVVIGGLFILPFLLFSATAGQLADYYPSDLIMRRVKDLEILIMAIAIWGFYAEQAWILLLCIFLMGLHSTFFGPVKYAYLPQTLAKEQLMGANALVQMGTFLAILIGNLLAGIFLSLPQQGILFLALACFLLALLGRVMAQFLPRASDKVATERINWNPISEISKNLKLAYQQKTLFITMLLISWMWFFGAVYLNLFPILSKDILRADESVASLILAIFAIGIGLGALFCERLAQRKWPLSLLGALGMSLFSCTLYWLIQAKQSADLINIMPFIVNRDNWPLLIAFLGLSISIGLFIVPLYTQLQQTSERRFVARIIAANNILNSIYLIASSLIVGFLLSANFTVQEIFLGLGLINLIYCFVLLNQLQRLRT
ncbi:MAG: MFS transporter [Pelistega sp.]|nr:MFS transporter [Pelistega sp.]